MYSTTSIRSCFRISRMSKSCCAFGPGSGGMAARQGQAALCLCNNVGYLSPATL